MTNIKKISGKILYAIFLLLLSIIMLLPVYYLLITTFKTPAEAAASPLGLPRHLTFDNYVNAIGAMHYGRSLVNNLIIAVVSVICLIIFASMAAYVVARGKRRIFRFMYSVFMVGLIIPFQTSIIPLYKIISGMSLMNRHLGVILVDVFCINPAPFHFPDEGLYQYGARRTGGSGADRRKRDIPLLLEDNFSPFKAYRVHRSDTGYPGYLE